MPEAGARDSTCAFFPPTPTYTGKVKGRRQTSSVGSQATPDCTEKGQAVATNLKNCTLGTDFFLKRYLLRYNCTI